MFKINPEYAPDKIGEASTTLCDPTHANEMLGWEPKKNIADYIKEYLNG